VHPQDRLAAFHVGPVDRDLPVEAPGPQQRRVKDVGPVGGRDQDDAALGVEAVHLNEQLVQRLLALVVATAEAGAAVAADRVDLVDEHDGRRVRLGLLEEITYAGGTDTDEHLDEVRPGDRVERHPRLTRDGPGQQRLAGAGRTVQQHALGDLRPERLVLRRRLQEVLDLVQLLDRLVGARHVRERRLRRVLGDQLGLGLAEVEHPGAAALHLRHEQQQKDDEHTDREQVDQQPYDDTVLGDLGVPGVDLLLGLERLQLAVEVADGVGRKLRLHLVGAVNALLEVEVERLLLVLQQDLLDVARLEQRDGLGGVDLLVAGATGEQGAGRDRTKDHNDEPDHWPAEETGPFHIVVGRGAAPGTS
jgi:hypothetical protein